MKTQFMVLNEYDKDAFILLMQEAFDAGAREGGEYFGEEILPRSHVEKSMCEEGSVAYTMLLNGEIAGGAIVNISETTGHNRLDFMFVRHGMQSKGIGQKIWGNIEDIYPETKVWETYTPYSEKRNIHFYVNKLGFSIVEFFNEYHQDIKELSAGEGSNHEDSDEMFRFEKKMLK